MHWQVNAPGTDIKKPTPVSSRLQRPEAVVG